MAARSLAATISLIGLGLAAAGTARSQEPTTEAQARALGVEAYIFGYPLLTMELTRRVMTNTTSPKDNRAPMGQFFHDRSLADPSLRHAAAPNTDMLHSTAWIDLSNEPYVLTIPDGKGRFYMVSLLDAWTNVFANPGKRTTGTRPQKYAITGPEWAGALPADVKELKSSTNLVWIIGQTYSNGTPADNQRARAFQDKYALVPLSAYGKPYPGPRGSVDPSINMRIPVRDQVNGLDAGTYFEMLARLMKQNPPGPGDQAAVEKLAKLGIVPGQDFSLSRIDPVVARGLRDVPREAQRAIMARAKSFGTRVNGWEYSTKLGAYGADYLQRAFAAAVSLGAHRPEDAIDPLSTADAAGQPYSGADGYVIHFPPGTAPPVRGYWSLTMYNARLELVANALHRYAIGSRDNLKYNRDGSLDLFIQNRSPGRDKESNWLPAPADRFTLMLRLYWPAQTSPTILDGTWQPPAVKQVAQAGIGGSGPLPP